MSKKFSLTESEHIVQGVRIDLPGRIRESANVSEAVRLAESETVVKVFETA